MSGSMGILRKRSDLDTNPDLFFNGSGYVSKIYGTETLILGNKRLQVDWRSVNPGGGSGA